MKTILTIVFLLIGTTAYADLKCGGTEPFWSLAIGEKKAVYEHQEGTKKEFDVVKQQDAAGITPGIVRKYTLRRDSTTADAIVHKRRCSDGMNDRTYPYEITFSVSDAFLTGCCR